jgi:hypothetical protein
MIAKWRPDDFFAPLNAERSEKLSGFVEEPEGINRKQRILLVAEAYDYEVLKGAEWLHAQYHVDIACCRIALATDAKSGAEYLSCTQVYPPSELAHEAVPRRRAAGQTAQFTSWQVAFASANNPAVKEYFASQLKAEPPRENNLGSNARLHYRVPPTRDGIRRWRLNLRMERAVCVQNGRFEGDVNFWRERISDADSVVTVKSGLRFFLSTAADFAAFDEALAEVSRRNVGWMDSREDDDGEEQGVSSSVETVAAD